MGLPVRVSALAKQYRGGHRVLDDVSFSVEPGEIVALLGPNGSGKSTLFRCALRLAEPTSGSVSIGSVDVTSASRGQLRGVRRQVGVVFQHFHLVGRLTAFHNVLLGAIGQGRSRDWWPSLASSLQRSEAMSCLERVGLEEFATQRADTLSGGQQQRVAIARMLMQRPRVILADEPVASLDPGSGLAVMELLASVAREKGLTTLVSLHQLDYALRFSDRILALDKGRICCDQPTSSITRPRLEALYEPAPA